MLSLIQEFFDIFTLSYADMLDVFPELAKHWLDLQKRLWVNQVEVKAITSNLIRSYKVGSRQSPSD